MGIQGMKAHEPVTRGFWDLECKQCLRRPFSPFPVAAKAAAFDLKSFIREPESAPRKNKESAQVEATLASGGTRWNPTHEQISLLETLYRRGLRTPKAQQIENITAQLRKYGKIEGKNVFYWFQNHKARERQKQKRNNDLSLTHSPRTLSASNSSYTTAASLSLSNPKVGDVEEQSFHSKPYKRNCRSWACFEEDNRYDTQDQEEHGQENHRNKTLKLFPLHPEGRRP